VFILFVGLIIQERISRKELIDPNKNIPPTPSFNLIANDIFFEEIAKGVDLNNGLMMIRQPFLLLGEGPTPSPNYVSFVVLNHSDEPITFRDQGYGMKVFTYEPKSQDWKELQMATYPAARATTLPPKLEKYDFDINNSWDISPINFGTDLPQEIRIYISGIGDTSGKQYGAFLDVALKP
jgi:hypothetical protein